MARRSKKNVETTDFRHGSAKRTNIPPAKIAGEGKVPDIGKQKYAYSPHLSPVLRFDPEGRADKVREVIEKACSGKSLTAGEQGILRAVGASWEDPSLEWAAKREERDRHWRTLDTVALHIHERVSANAILGAAKRKDVERTLFADPELDYREAVQFYKHDMDWANRLILGDSMEVMASLARREDLAGKVQMIYMDPPYGIKFGSNFQPEVGSKEVKGAEKDLSREPETVKAYRDTWRLGVHSYLGYLRERLVVARDLLRDTGSIFLQINDENLHRVRALMDEVFGSENFVSNITFKTTSGFQSKTLGAMGDYLIWYARSKDALRVNRLFEEQPQELGAGNARWLLCEDRSYRGVSKAEIRGEVELPAGSRLYNPGDLQSQGASSSPQPFEFMGAIYSPGGNSHWKANYPQGMNRLRHADRIHRAASSIRYRRFADDFPYTARGNFWTDTETGSFTEKKRFVVQTNTKVVERCMLLATRPGDLVLDPTCGSGTTALVAEQWGRRWITTDTSRVALSIARQRLLTASFDRYLLDSERGRQPLQGGGVGVSVDCDFAYASAPRVTLGGIARNENLDPIIERHEAALNEKMSQLNQLLANVPDSVRTILAGKLLAAIGTSGVRAVSNADCDRLLIPGTTSGHVEEASRSIPGLQAKHVRWVADQIPSSNHFEEWNVPFEVDEAYPEGLAAAVLEYRDLWRARLDAINECIAANVDREELIDQPEIVPGLVRVTGPFTVEGVLPEELKINEEGLFGGTPNEDLDHAEIGDEHVVEMQNLHSYLNSMVGHLKSDGVTFPDNKNPKFTRLESLFDSDSATALHAEGVWEGDDADGPARVGVGFGPQYGPVTAKQVEELIRESSRRGYDELVVAGFSFDAEAHAIIHEDPNPKVRVHMAQIRPDLNAGMDGLLKDTPSSQLFTVFGSPAIEVARDGGEYSVTLEGVDIYDPVKNTVRSTGAAKVAAWFLDSDYDGRTFCITQAFFPDQDAWGKLAKALKDVIDPETFAAFKGTTSLPFELGEHKQIAVKVIDPRGSEVMTIHKLEG